MTLASATPRFSATGLAPEASQAISGIILDCDGVLFDSKAANTAYYNHIRYAVHLPPMDEEEAAYSHMASAAEALDRIIPDELKKDALSALDQLRFRDTFMAMMQPSPHVFTFLRTMKEQGMPLALCTNRSDSVHEVLRYFNMDSYFSPVMTITHAQPKPAPQGLQEIVSAWRTTPSSVAFIGDSLVDQQAATAAGTPFWSFGNPQLTAELHITDFKELTEMMRLMLMR